MAILYYPITILFILVGSSKSDCLNGTSRRCYKNELCYQNQCYPAHGLITTNPTCFDYSPLGGFSDCPSRAHLCNNPIYYNLMTKQCPRTCNRCPSITSTLLPPIPGCFDRIGANGRSNCAFVAHLCQNLLYFNVMKQQCARTCKFC
ncbi:ShTK domain-containing protein [Wuchereria bancrofti]|uniref:ShTK domain-containing protein n=1 Tax=Wuchereria bancrofti TaxID=6293 RepID=J9AUE9_WUCBA|nr:ShTK domain-containing protein [Wuchereria bancrofti]